MKNEHLVKEDIVILGAGLAGLSAAQCGGVIYEKEREVGGTCRSQRKAGYAFDQGIHVLHTRNKYVLRLLSAKKGLGFTRKKRSAWIYSHGALTKYPFQANTFGLPSRIIFECLAGFIDTFDKPRKRYGNYEEWIYGAFGKGIADNFYLPYSEKFWTVGAKELTTDWLDVRVPRPKTEQVIVGAFSLQKEEFGPNTLFRYPRRGGIQSIPEALLGQKKDIVFRKEAVKIDTVNKSVLFSDGSRVYYRKLISTMPLPEIVKIVDNVPARVSRAAGELRHNSVLCINLAVKDERLNATHWIYFPEEKFAPFRISFPRNFSSLTVPKGWSSIQAEISYSRERPLARGSIVDKVIKGLIAAGILKGAEKIKSVGTDDIKYAYVIYDHKRRSNAEEIRKFLRENDIYTAGRYGEWKYLWMDEAILSGRQAAMEAGKMSR
ncbi:MAG: FAD-dependent oxidoreductase [Candidatus Omnitrophota bacterium]